MPVADSVTKNPIRNHQKRTMKADAVISKDFSLKEFKKVGKRFNATFNDVVLACQAKATRVYFENHAPSKNFSPVMSYMSTSERVDATIGNFILAAFVTFELPLDAKTPLKDYLPTIKTEMHKFKHTPYKYAASVMRKVQQTWHT
jgi:uncharacterized protein (DUF427 family)